MTEKLTAWAQRYQELKNSGEIGWTGDESYRHKQSRIEVALQEHPIPAPARFLELGCGAGNITLWMAEQGYEAYGMDIVPEAIDWAKDRMASSSAPADFRVGDIASMDSFSDAFFDIVFDGDCFHMITGPTRPRCFSEVFRVLRHGGLFITGSNTRNDQITERVEWGEGAAYFDPQSRCVFVEGRQEYLLLTEPEMTEEMTAAGFKVMSYDRRPKIGGQPFLDYWLEVHAIRP
ncbi:MAG: class I SAM-dependent methyltransferase [Armatimonadetes bacterium]|nr:class I SAM-dependent methyltransferase [Armatimonadota bacterium]